MQIDKIRDRYPDLAVQRVDQNEYNAITECDDLRAREKRTEDPAYNSPIERQIMEDACVSKV